MTIRKLMIIFEHYFTGFFYVKLLTNTVLWLKYLSMLDKFDSNLIRTTALALLLTPGVNGCGGCGGSQKGSSLDNVGSVAAEAENQRAAEEAEPEAEKPDPATSERL